MIEYQSTYDSKYYFGHNKQLIYYSVWLILLSLVTYLFNLYLSMAKYIYLVIHNLSQQGVAESAIIILLNKNSKVFFRIHIYSDFIISK